MEKEIEELRGAAMAAIGSARHREDLGPLRIQWLGRQGRLSQLFKKLSESPVQQRATLGKALNDLKAAIQSRLEEQEQKLALTPRPAPVGFDVTLPGRRSPLGRRHPLSQTMERIKTVFGTLGFEMAYGPEIETAHYNFDALNIPVDHPSRDAFDTFFLSDGRLLRSQTSTVQVRVMEKRIPPLRIVAPGRVYRPDRVDATHHFMFHQVEGLVVDRRVTFADMKYVLEVALQALFGRERKMRLVPSFFPFTEPSAEVFMSCPFCEGGCAVCSRSGWLEIAGCGMVDPNVFRAVGYPEGEYTGFAFGFGLDRIAMLAYGIHDIRLFTENDCGFLHQF
ncbi:MAG: phenylalanine--tRNA ligase subunit alpha [Planctomycetes bacterium]|nr:phenylalanine--tRNA ligase subunit alpha [Planctomycetota bacterium]